MEKISSIYKILEQDSKKIVITTHHKPDGDAIGSSLGLYHFLKQLGHQATVISPSEIPDFLQWLPSIDTVLNYEAESKLCNQTIEEADYIFCLDFSRLERVKYMEQLLRNATQPKILIDHHLNPEIEVFQYGICEPEKSSTCEMVYDFVKTSKRENIWSQELMQCLYTGLLTDTGSFKFPATTASSFLMAAEFKQRGLNHSIIYENLWDNDREERLRLLGYAINNKMQILQEQNLGIISLSQKDLIQFNANSGDTEGIVNFPLSIKGIKIAVLLIERKDEIKLSFRSKGNIDVSMLAHNHFNGGGHFNAAGGRYSGKLEDAVNQVKEILFNNKL